jgi:Fe-S cluster assembly protein SufD
MIDLETSKDHYASQFEELEKRSAGREDVWLLPLRKAAIARFAELGFPGTRHEEWRYTNVAPIAKSEFEPASADLKTVTREQLSPFVFGDPDPILLVFVNGFFNEALSSLAALPKGVRVGSLATAVKQDVPLLEPHLGRHAAFDDQAFVALNTALMQDGALVHLGRNVVADRPIHLLFFSTASERPYASHPRVLILADPNSQAAIVEHYAGADEGTYFTNPVTEIVACENAVIDHYKVERESEEAFHVSTTQIHQYKSSAVSSHTISLGGRLVRHDLNAVLDEEGCDCTLNGLYMINGNQHVDNHLRVVHARPHCTSREFFKGILDGRARGVFTGRIIVCPDAQKTDGKQTNMNLLLSEEAQVESKPQLEIFADDVKCTHGATIGQVDKDALFYLRSRGLADDAARSMLIYAFARESLEHIQVEGLRTQLEQLLFERMPHGQPPQEALR